MDPNRTSKESLTKNIEILTKTSEQIVNLIYHSLDKIPHSIRRVLRNLFKLVEGKWGKEKGFISVGGFFFLRFICPMIVSPELLFPSGNFFLFILLFL